MPVYDYKCREHGLFNTLATMEDAAKPAECPTCKALSPRVIVLPSHIAAMDPAKGRLRTGTSGLDTNRFSPPRTDGPTIRSTAGPAAAAPRNRVNPCCSTPLMGRRCFPPCGPG